MIPKNAAEAYRMGYLDCGGSWSDKTVGPNLILRKGFFEFEEHLDQTPAKDLPFLQIPFCMRITFGKPRRPRTQRSRKSNVIEMPLRKVR
jgi:hypothetical protein